MKMNYEKPMVAVENYELTQTIATCTLKIGHNDANCVRNDGDATTEMKRMAIASGWFVAGCTTHPIDGSTNDGVCYHSNVNLAFTS